MQTWAEDPELVATFRAEVDERLASLSAGLMQLEGHASPRQLVGSLFRDAHTIKGSARMLGADRMLHLAHAAEDLLGALRDGRLEPGRAVVDVLLAACDAIARCLSDGMSDDQVEVLVAALRDAEAGRTPTVPPQPAAPAEPAPAPDPEGEPAEGAATAASAASATTSTSATTSASASDSVRVTAAKVYALLDDVGESELAARRVERGLANLDRAVTDHDRWAGMLRDALTATAQSLPSDVQLALHRLLGASDSLATQARTVRESATQARTRLAEVRDGAMSLAMVPVRRVTAALPRLVRDVAAAGGKDVALVVDGADVELDKQVLDAVADSLKHLVTNAVDHGCETSAERARHGKPPRATVTVRARSAGGTVVLEVSDDGNGIDEASLRSTAVARGLVPADSALAGPALLRLLFAPGLSTAATVTETSGRGVGLDVVQNAVEALSGSVDVISEPGVGTTFRLTLPVTLGVLRCLLARVGGERYAMPVAAVAESISLKNVPVHEVAGARVVVRHGTSLPLLDLGAALGVDGDREPRAAIVVRHGDRQVAWAVDRLEGEEALVVKDLGPFLGRLPAVTGATIDGDGSVVCIIDVRELVDRGPATVAVPAPQSPAAAAPDAVGRARILVVEDSVGVRELERVILEGAGYEVVTAVDGLDGAARLREAPTDAVISDVEMPGMDGYTLTRTIRRTRGWEHVPVIIMTSRGAEEDQRAGLDAGASAYLLKNQFDQTQLVETVRRLVGR